MQVTVFNVFGGFIWLSAYHSFRLQNYLYCVGWGIKLYSLAHAYHRCVGNKMTFYVQVYHLKITHCRSFECCKRQYHWVSF